MIDAELMVIFDPVTTSYSRGDGKWFAQFYDRATAGFYAGTGATALEAIAWAMDEYQTRGVLKIHRVARGPEERPGDLFRRAQGIAEGMAKAFTEAIEAPRVVWPATIETTGDVTQVAFRREILGEPAPFEPIVITEESIRTVRPMGSCFELQIDDAKRANEPPKKRKKAKGT